MDAGESAGQMARMITGYWVSQAIYAAAKFSLADLMSNGPRPVAELASLTETDPASLFRLLRALASVGVFAETEPGRFGLTPMADLLRSDAPHSLRALALMTGGDQFAAWSEMEYCLRTGRSGFEKKFGMPLFEHLERHPENAAVFDAAMTGIHGQETAAILDAYDFSTIQVLADVGGGNGTKLTAILKRHPGLRGILFDLPHVAERARRRVVDEGLSDRCEVVGGSFFESVPTGADAIVMRHILHDWYDEQAIAILKNCHAALPPGGRVLVVESVIPPGNEPFAGKLLDLTMLVVPGGKERTAEEYRMLYQQAGFRLSRIVPSKHEVSVVEGIKD